MVFVTISLTVQGKKTKHRREKKHIKKKKNKHKKVGRE